jgi:hypothetical protein
MERVNRTEYWSRAALPLANAEVAEKGKIACLDTSDGLVYPAQAGTTLRPIGTFDENLTGDGATNVHVTLWKEVVLKRFNNSGTDPVDADDIGSLCYLEDDETVGETDQTNTLSAAGRVWGVSSSGVLVEMGAA